MTFQDSPVKQVRNYIGNLCPDLTHRVMTSKVTGYEALCPVDGDMTVPGKPTERELLSTWLTHPDNCSFCQSHIWDVIPHCNVQCQISKKLYYQFWKNV